MIFESSSGTDTGAKNRFILEALPFPLLRPAAGCLVLDRGWQAGVSKRCSYEGDPGQILCRINQCAVETIVICKIDNMISAAALLSVTAAARASLRSALSR